DFANHPPRARRLTLVQASADRVDPPCREAIACGGCDFMQLAPRAQVRWHAEIVRVALEHARVPLPPITTHAPPRTEGYGTRARLAVRAGPGGVVVGYRKSRSHDLHDVGSCLVLDTRLGPVLGQLREILTGERGEGETAVALGRGERPVAE